MLKSCGNKSCAYIVFVFAGADTAHAEELVEQEVLVAEKVFVEEADRVFDVVEEHADSIFLVVVTVMSTGW